MDGLLQRIGRDVCSNTALDHKSLLAILANMEIEIRKQSLSNTEREFLTVVVTYLVVCFCASLRGNEGFMMGLGPTYSHLHLGIGNAEEVPHVVVCLLVRYKG